MALSDILHKRRVQSGCDQPPRKATIKKSRSFLNYLSLGQLPKSKVTTEKQVKSHIPPPPPYSNYTESNALSGLQPNKDVNQLPNINLVAPLDKNGIINEHDLNFEITNQLQKDAEVSEIKEDSEFSMGDIISPYQYSIMKDTSIMKDNSSIFASPPNIKTQIIYTNNKICQPQPLSPLYFNSIMNSDLKTPKLKINSESKTPPKDDIENQSPIPDNIDQLSFDENVSHSTTRQSYANTPYKSESRSNIAMINSATKSNVRDSLSNGHYTDEGSIIDANFQIFKPYTLASTKLKFISTSSPIPSTKSVSPLSPSSPSPAPRLKTINKVDYTLQNPSTDHHSVSEEVSDPLDSESEDADNEELDIEADHEELDDELEFSFNPNDMFRNELLQLVEKHKVMLQKQQEEIDHLKQLLLTEKKFTSILSSSPQNKSVKTFSSPKNTNSGTHSLSTSNASNNFQNRSSSNLHNPRTKRRSGFIPINIILSKDEKSAFKHSQSYTTENDTNDDINLLPPFRPTSASSLSSQFSNSKPKLSASPTSSNHVAFKVSNITDESYDNTPSTFTASNTLDGQKEKYMRNHSVSSNVSSVMSTSHAKNSSNGNIREYPHSNNNSLHNSKTVSKGSKGSVHCIDNLIELGIVNDYNHESSFLANDSISSTVHSNITTPDSLNLQLSIIGKKISS